MAQKPLSKEEPHKIPLRAKGSYSPPAKVGFSPLPGEIPRPLPELTGKEVAQFEALKAQLEVVFGRTTLTLKELATLQEGSLLPLDDLCDDLVDIFINGEKIGRGEVVKVDDHFGVKLVSFTKN